MSSELMDALRELAREKNIDETVMLERLEEQLAVTYKRILDSDNDCSVTIDRESGRIHVYELVPVGGTEEEPVFEARDVTPSDISRYAATAAKQVITQSIREAEREQIFEEYADRIGDSITGTVQQSDSRYTLVKIREGVEALLPHAEQPPNERYEHNQRLKALIIDVRKTSNEPSIVVSRTHPNLLKRLFELEVPEIYDGIVEIKSVAREPGMRSKIAVSSREPGLDPVGACVGPKGSRVRMVVAELRGERIDVVPWSEDPATFVGNALSPAKVARVVVSDDTHTATVIVPDDQLSLAIGKEGQNARLAAKLTGWRIDIKSLGQAVSTGLAEAVTGGDLDGDEGDGRCIAVTSTGIRCRNQARPGSRYCGVHEKEAADES
ncbi:MAG TPA: antitermination protein NusA [Coriobacteriia bacterium]|uniref:transcription termination factor NusA n=1 Tax=Anaerosoma tenue TaxID=2933588 RepID=UPI00076BE553|nr:transcription termination factor NusA [Anaerosoma tenue]KUK48744.1 MAG: Transcription elongation factor [Actinobacteria bacterium 66_15]MCK8114223.1 transcription termination factor NusA [Anaerosoma tenue]HAL30176.1 antitermination protein NusA [Coriobacteriia bacterium]